MTSDAEEALSWEGDDDQPARSRPTLPDGWKAVGKDSETVGHRAADGTVTAPEDTQAPASPSTPMLLFIGIIGGIYLLYTVGWVIGGLNLQVSALFLVSSVMYQVGVWAAVLAPAFWFAAVWLLTRRSAAWIRVVGLIAGAVLLVPWPFVLTGAAGA